MNFLEHFSNLTKALFNTQLEIRQIREEQVKDRQSIRDLDSDFNRLSHKIQELRERVVRLETQRDADREQMKAELARFMLDVERAALRQERSQLTPPIPSTTSEKQD